MDASSQNDARLKPPGYEAERVGESRICCEQKSDRSTKRLGINEDVVREIHAFLLPLIQAITLKQNFTSSWTSGGPWSLHQP